MTTLAFIMFDGAGGAAGGWAAGRLYQVRKNTFVNFKLFCFFIGTESDHQQPLSTTHLLTGWLLFSRLVWCDPGMWKCLLKTCWCCCCCRCWWWGSCWKQFVADLGAEVWFVQTLSIKVWSEFGSWSSGKILMLEFVQHFATDVL